MMSTNPEIVTLLVAELHEHWEFYPRQSGVDSSYVTSIVEAIQSGVDLPPIMVDRRSKRLVDGLHRVQAVKRLYGDKAQIRAELRDFKNEQEMFEYAMWANNLHGRRLDQHDRIRCTKIAQSLGIPTSRIALALSCSEEKVIKLSLRFAEVPVTTPGVLPIPPRTPPRNGGTQTLLSEEKGTLSHVLGIMPMKSSLLHLSNTVLTSAQAEAVNRAPGMPYSLLAYQLQDAIKHNLIDETNERLLHILRELRDTLDAYDALDAYGE